MVKRAAGIIACVWMTCLLFGGISCGGGGGSNGDGGNGGSTDTTAPTVIATSPTDTASGVALNTTISISFSEEMDATTVSATTITVDNGVTGVVAYTGGAFAATFTPSSDLSASTTYTVTVSSSCEDTAGNPLAVDYTWTFETGTSADTTAPQVAAVSPADGATMVALNTDMTAVFNENMDSSTIVAAAFTLSDGSSSITGTVSYNASTRMATFAPASSLAGSTVYTATLTTTCRDTAGNGLVADYTWSFTTGNAWSSVGGRLALQPLSQRILQCW